MRDGPQELIDHIVDFAHDDQSTLCSARLVSRTWNISARVHLFRKLDLLVETCSSPCIPHSPSSSEPNVGQAKFKRLLDVLQTSPDMPYCVREIIIGNTTHLSSLQWELYEALLNVVLPQLKRVNTLSLRQVDWSSLSFAFAHTIMELCQFPELKHLDVWNCQMPSMEGLMDFLNFSCGLMSLRLSHIRIPTREVPEDGTMIVQPPTLGVINTMINRPRKPLQSLVIETVPLAPLFYSLLATTPCSVDITKLRSLSLNHINDVPSLQHFLQAAGSSLENLEMGAASLGQSRCLTQQGKIDLHCTPQLRYLRLSGLSWTSSLCPGECLAALFASVDFAHPLESLRVVINVMKRRGADGLDIGAWRVLDEELSRPGRFSRLKKVELVLYSLGAKMGEVDIENLTAAFGQLRAGGSDRLRVVCP